ncbi:hypothetical protein BC835DRAFT_338732 [Cytidiella melzeri]|nr:hypothetical protein BC835DRAFT_338732 [Cytidiella melzeri]
MDRWRTICYAGNDRRGRKRRDIHWPALQSMCRRSTAISRVCVILFCTACTTSMHAVSHLFPPHAALPHNASYVLSPDARRPAQALLTNSADTRFLPTTSRRHHHHHLPNMPSQVIISLASFHTLSRLELIRFHDGRLPSESPHTKDRLSDYLSDALPRHCPEFSGLFCAWARDGRITRCIPNKKWLSSVIHTRLLPVHDQLQVR